MELSNGNEILRPEVVSKLAETVLLGELEFQSEYKVFHHEAKPRF